MDPGVSEAPCNPGTDPQIGVGVPGLSIMGEMGLSARTAITSLQCF